MASRRVYTDEEKASVFVALTANQGNVKRTARHTGIPISTVRRWKEEWVTEGPPDTSQVIEAAGDFLADAQRVRNKALMELERKIPDATPSALVTTVGVLTDKINVVSGLATSRNETVHSLPPAEEIARTLSSAFAAAIEAARARDADIVDAEIIDAELDALPAPSHAEQA